jgi:membrane-bound lytic murein transglycosylase B
LLVPAETQVGPSYRVGFKNFEVITRYNRSVRYAMAVHDLATTIASRVTPEETKLAAQPTGPEAAVR